MDVDAGNFRTPAGLDLSAPVFAFVFPFPLAAYLGFEGDLVVSPLPLVTDLDVDADLGLES